MLLTVTRRYAIIQSINHKGGIDVLGKLYAITDRLLVQDCLADDINAAIDGGADMIQIREKNVTDEEYAARAKEALNICRCRGVRLIVNDNIEVCRAIGADGVHLGQGDASVHDARRLLGKNAVIGVTAKTVEQARRAYNDGADYIGSGAVFGTSTKNDAKKMSLEALKEITSASRLPVYAIGGINSENISRLKDTGIYGVAVISGIFKGNIRDNARRLKEALENL